MEVLVCGGSVFFLWCRLSRKSRKTNGLCIMKNILEKNLLPLAKNETGADWDRDVDPKHTSKLVKGWLESPNITIPKWPVQSPDLISIKNLSEELGRRLGSESHSLKQRNCFTTYSVNGPLYVVKHKTRSRADVQGSRNKSQRSNTKNSERILKFHH